MGCVQSAIHELENANSNPQNRNPTRPIQQANLNHKSNSPDPNNGYYQQQYQATYQTQPNYQYSAPPMQNGQQAPNYYQPIYNQPQTVNQSMNQPFNQPINQPVNQPMN